MKKRMISIMLILSMTLTLLPNVVIADAATSNKKTSKGMTRKINFDNLYTFEISNSYAYTRTIVYDSSGANVCDYIVVADGAKIKCSKYSSNDYNLGNKAYYDIAPFSIIMFENGAMMPVTKHTTENWEKGELTQGKALKAQNGTRYFFLESSNDRAITSKYGKASVVYYSINVYVVPADIAAKVGGKASSTGGLSGYVQTFYVPSGASSGEVTCVIDPAAAKMKDGWYNIEYDNESENKYLSLGINKKGYGGYGSQDWPNYYVKNKGNNQVTIQMEDGRYLGIDGAAKKNAKLKAVDKPYLWKYYFEGFTRFGYSGIKRYSLRPSTNTKLLLSVTGTVKEGASLILVSQNSLDAPRKAELSFEPLDEDDVEDIEKKKGKQITDETASDQKDVPLIIDELEDDGIYYIKSSNSTQLLLDVNEASKENGAKIIIYTRHGDNQKFRITKVKEDQYTIKCVHSDKWLTRSKTKGAVLTQSGSVTDESAKTFTIVKQEDGSYRIKDSKGFYLGIASAEFVNGTIVILWTEAFDASQTFYFEKVK